MNRLLSFLSSVSFLSETHFCLHLLVWGHQGCFSKYVQDHPQLPLSKWHLLFYFIFLSKWQLQHFNAFFPISRFRPAFISVLLWSVRWLAMDRYALCRSFEILSCSVLFRFPHSLAIMHIIWTVNVIKLKWNIYTVPFAESFGLGKWMRVSDILKHVGVWFIDICWHQCVYLKKSRSLYKCKWEMTSHLFPRRK